MTEKRRESSEEKELPLAFPELTQIDASKECPVYTECLAGKLQKIDAEKLVEYAFDYQCGTLVSVIQEISKASDEESDEKKPGKDLQALQTELEILLYSVLKRQDDLEREISILVQDKNGQEKTDKKFNHEKFEEGEFSGKRSFDVELHPNKKYKDNASRPKMKNFQQHRCEFQAHDYDDSEPPEENKPLRTDAPNRFWASVEPYFADITSAHIKFLEDWIKDHDDDEESYFRIPLMGNHYSSEWSSKIVEEEQTEGLKALDKNKEHADSSSLDFTDSESILSEAEKDSEPEEAPSLGPLAHRLACCLIEDKVTPSLEDTIDIKEEFHEHPENPNSEINFLTSLNIDDAVTVERKVRKELEAAGIMDPVATGVVENPEDPILAEIKELQESLRMVTDYNLTQKKKLLERARREMARQEIEKKLLYLDSEIIDISRRWQKKKIASKKEKEKEQILAKLKEREDFKAELETLENYDF